MYVERERELLYMMLYDVDWTENIQPPSSPCALACPSDWPSQLSGLQGSSGPVGQTEPWSHSHPGDSSPSFSDWEPIGWRRNSAENC